MDFHDKAKRTAIWMHIHCTECAPDRHNTYKMVVNLCTNDKADKALHLSRCCNKQ
ncbi:hypothetical protein P0136_05880 [Lentisphaerota bacterium ZTH]|nr:hypothetical protein JYG24_03005 [Lentisphaerota bacterium]WET07520.1 hypothetical protein P0136_05880 [Lentisphaerota bacterium ZTH]